MTKIEIENECGTCEEIYFHMIDKQWSFDIERWDTHFNEIDCTTLKINYCYECGKKYENNENGD